MNQRKHRHYHVTLDSVASSSKLKEWNASFKALFAVTSLICVIAADSILFSLMTLIFMGGLTCFVGNIRIRDYARLFVLPLGFILMSGIAVMFQIGSGEESIFCISFFASNLYLTRTSIMQALSLSLNAFGAISCLFLLTLSTPMGEIICVLQKIHVPAMILELMHFIYRYIFILLQISAGQKEAVRSRLGYCDKKTAFRSFASEAANLFILSMSKSQQYYDALESRGGNGSYLFWEEKRALTLGQIKYAAMYILFAVILLQWRK